MTTRSFVATASTATKPVTRKRTTAPRPKRGEREATPRARLAAVTRSLNSLITAELESKTSAPPGGRQVDLATGATIQNGTSFPILLMVSQQNGHTDHAGHRSRLGHPRDLITRFQVLDPANSSELASGSFGNGQGSRRHRMTEAAKTLCTWLDGKLAELNDGVPA